MVAALSVTAAELVYHLAAAFRQSPAAGARANMALVDAIEQVVKALHQKPTAEDIDIHLRRYLGILGSLVVTATDGARRLVEAEERVARGEEP